MIIIINITLNGRFLKDYINGDGKTDFTTKENVTSPQDVYLLEHHLQFIRSTEQFFYYPENCNGRIKHIFDVIEKFNDIFMTVLLENPNDFAFKLDALTGRWRIFPSLLMPEIPPFQGKQSFSFFFNTIVANYFFLPNSKQESLFKHNFFYYRAKSKQLFMIKDFGPGPSPPGNILDNHHKWEIHSIGLSPIEPKPFLQLPGSINTQNYVVYIIQLKKVPVERSELAYWLKNVIIDYS